MNFGRIGKTRTWQEEQRKFHRQEGRGEGGEGKWRFPSAIDYFFPRLFRPMMRRSEIGTQKSKKKLHLLLLKSEACSRQGILSPAFGTPP